MLVHQRVIEINVNPGLINHGLFLLGGYSSNSHFIYCNTSMVPSQLNSRLGFINPGLTLIGSLNDFKWDNVVIPILMWDIPPTSSNVGKTMGKTMS